MVSSLSNRYGENAWENSDYSGLIGRCWAILFSKADYPVVLYDVNPDQMQNAQQSINIQLQDLVQCGVITKEDRSLSLENISFSSDLHSALKDAKYVQECIPEVLQLKKDLFAKLDQIISSDTIVGSSTSCIVPSLFVEGLEHCERYLAAHPVNPPHFIPVVELVPSQWTNTKTIETVKELMKDIGQAPIVVKKEVNGFVLNRLQYALIMEAWRLVEDGICSPEDVDTAMTKGLGPRYAFIGPFETMHLNAQGFQDYCQRYGGNIFKICEGQNQPRPMKGMTCDVINSAMCRNTPVQDLDTRRKWRDEKLASLSKLRHNTTVPGKHQKEDDNKNIIKERNGKLKEQIECKHQ